MTCSNPDLRVDGSNLCVQATSAAFEVLERMGHTPEGVAIHLDKHLPFGAGLGGGSSDAAATLRAVNDLFKAPLTEEQLHNLAADLGSDVPFFLDEAGVALGTGRGEILHSIPFPKALRSTWLLVVVPPVHISTAEAFSGIRPEDADRADLLALMSEGSLSDWQELLVNDFERHLFELHPSVAALKEEMQAMGASYTAMSGSGSSVFGIFKDEATATATRAALAVDVRSWLGPSDAALSRS
jgi:4-diphosphocytidyl-2-C-methyl-D-erythritol kinase